MSKEQQFVKQSRLAAWKNSEWKWNVSLSDSIFSVAAQRHDRERMLASMVPNHSKKKLNFATACMDPQSSCPSQDSNLDKMDKHELVSDHLYITYFVIK